MSAWPACRAVSLVMWASTHRARERDVLITARSGATIAEIARPHGPPRRQRGREEVSDGEGGHDHTTGDRVGARGVLQQADHATSHFGWLVSHV
jgi:hypothetical protein